MILPASFYRRLYPFRMKLRNVAFPFRRLTAGDRVLPDFFIIGAQKSGTSSLYEYLTQHPLVRPAWVKEIGYFHRNYERGERWYRANFPTSAAMKSPHGAQCLTGEASTCLFQPVVPARAHALLPAVKLIALLRNPVARAFSHYQHNFRQGYETLSFADAIAAEPERLAGEVDALQRDPRYRCAKLNTFSYLWRGRYYEHLSRWLEHYPREQLLVLCAEEFFADTPRVFADVLRYLGLPDSDAFAFERHNVGGYADRMDPTLHTQLRDYYRPLNAKLTELVGRDFGWDT